MVMGYNAIGQRMVTRSVSGVENITTVNVSNASFDDLYATKIDESIKPEQIIPPDEWDSATYFHAKMNGTIYSGNAEFSVNNTTNILVKRRKKGEFKWFTIFDIPATKAEDYKFTVIDPYAPQGDLEYAIVPIINGFESEYSIGEIYYNFVGLMLLEKENSIWTAADISISENKNAQIGVANTLAGKYPFVFYNGENNYFSGDVSATFIDFSEDCVMPETDKIHKYYANVMEFLNNKKPKIMKYDDGRIRLIAITTPPNDTQTNNYNKHTISFSYTEIGSVYSNKDMNDFGFLDVGEEWWNE